MGVENVCSHNNKLNVKMKTSVDVDGHRIADNYFQEDLEDPFSGCTFSAPALRGSRQPSKKTQCNSETVTLSMIVAFGNEQLASQSRNISLNK